MVLVPAMDSLVIAVIISMPMTFMAVLFVALSIVIVIFVFVAMFIVTTSISMTLLGKNDAGA
jgi:hypothetical protein